MTEGILHSQESFASADGPGVRYLFFLFGCRLRCRYCHNPDTWFSRGSTTRISPDDALAKALRYRSYWGEEGGITVSGGEPLLQPEFVAELFEKAKAQGVSTCLDTAGEPFSREEPAFSRINAVLRNTDLVLLDIKHIDSEAHRKLTGSGNEKILDFARYLSEIKKPVWIRHVLVPGVTSNEASLTRLAEFIQTLGNVRRVEVLPYHTLGVFKWKALNLPYTLEDVPVPTGEEIARAKSILGCSEPR